MAQRIRDINDFYDIVTSIPGGQFVTLCYVSVANVGKSLQNVSDLDSLEGAINNSDAANADKWRQQMQDYVSQTKAYRNAKDTLSAYQMRKKGFKLPKLPFQAIFSFTIMQYHWQSQASFKKNKQALRQRKTELEKDFDIYKAPEDRHNNGQLDQQVQNYGSNQMRMTADNVPLIGQNKYGNNRKFLKSIYYAVTNEGEVMEMDKNVIIKMLTKKKSYGNAGLKMLKDLNAHQNTLFNYMIELSRLQKEVAFEPQDLRADRILFMVSHYKGETVFYLNSAFAENFDGVQADRSKFINIARQMIDKTKSYNAIVIEAIRRKKKALMESRIARIVRSSMRKVLAESRRY